MSDSAMRVRLTDTGGFMVGYLGPTDGDYDVAICGATPTIPHLMQSAIVQSTIAAEWPYIYYRVTLSSTPISCTAGNEADLCGAPVENVNFELSEGPITTSASAFPFSGFLYRWGPESSQTQCFIDSQDYTGQVQIISVDATSVTFHVSDTADFGSPSGNSDGTFTAPLCGN